jgi:hypothetical protein
LFFGVAKLMAQSGLCEMKAMARPSNASGFRDRLNQF